VDVAEGTNGVHVGIFSASVLHMPDDGSLITVETRRSIH